MGAVTVQQIHDEPTENWTTDPGLCDEKLNSRTTLIVVLTARSANSGPSPYRGAYTATPIVTPGPNLRDRPASRAIETPRYVESLIMWSKSRRQPKLAGPRKGTRHNRAELAERDGRGWALPVPSPS